MKSIAPQGRVKKVAKNTEPFDIEQIEIPAWVGEEGRELLEQILPELSYSINANDIYGLFQLGAAYSISVDAAKTIMEEGSIIHTKDGVRKNPFLQVFRDATALYTGLAARYGLTPADRAKITQESNSKAGVDTGLMEIIRKSNA